MSITAERQTDEALKVFISYSRAQVAFADDLALSLEHNGHDVIMDRTDIQYGEEDFQNRLRTMLEACGTVVFVLSDESAQSKTCIWETETAKELGKRTLVVTLGELSDGIEPPPALSKINWVHCWRNPAIPGASQAKGFVELDKALRADIGWLTKRTAYQVDALNWQNRGSDPDSPILLRGELLAEAMAWSRETPAQETVPEDIAAFIKASEEHENRLTSEARKQATAVRRVGLMGIAASVVLMALAAGLGWWGWQTFGEAQDLSAEVQKQSSDFIAREAAAIYEKESGDHTLSMLMALQADPLARKNLLRQKRFGDAGFKNALAGCKPGT